MKIINSIRRSVLGCFSSISPTHQQTQPLNLPQEQQQQQQPEASDSSSAPMPPSLPPPNPLIVAGTFFGPRQGRLSFCIQLTRLSSKPFLLLDLSMPTSLFAKEMRTGLLRIALECRQNEMSMCSLHLVPLWTMYCNGRNVGFAARRRPSDKDKRFLKAMQSTSAGAGVFQGSNSGADGEEGEIMYMRATFERVVGSLDSESYHLINPRGSPGQELGIFLMRSE